MQYQNTPKIVGAGKSGIMKKKNLQIKPKLPTPKDRKKATLKTWEDRNRANNGTKLNK
jgi:hypothetical protein|tara:strand:+ start:344 stop:517 length:174 start_codon:yes stop_codon:yes gene_type:complete